MHKILSVTWSSIFTCREHGVYMEAVPNWYLFQSKPYTALSHFAVFHIPAGWILWFLFVHQVLLEVSTPRDIKLDWMQTTLKQCWN